MSPKTFLPKLASLTLSLTISAFSLSLRAAPEEEMTVEYSTEPESNTVYFPQFQLFETVKNEVEMTGEITGRLDLADECLRVVTRQGSYLLVWPGWYDFAIDGREIVVTKIKTSDVVGHLRIGSRVSFSGAELVYFPTTALQYKIPEQCLGPLWAVGEIQSARTVVETAKDSSPTVQKKFPRAAVKEPEKPVKLPPQIRKEPPKKGKKPEQNQEMRKLEILLEKTILK